MGWKDDVELSVIVPVYNVEQYIKKCVQSILDQTFKNLELILVDDCSTDNSYEVCLQMAAMDSRIRIIHHEKNYGVAQSRNDGIDVANGKYLAFVDGDDWINPEMYENLVNRMKTLNLDLIKSAFYTVQENTYNYLGSKILGEFNQEEIQNKIIFQYIGDSPSFSGVPMCIFKKDIIYKNKIKFPLYKVKEDLYFLIEYLLSSSKIEIVAEAYYNYYMRQTSASHLLIFRDIEYNQENQEVIYNLFSNKKLLTSKFYSSLGYEYVNSILNLANGCNKKDFCKAVKEEKFRKHMYFRNIIGMSFKFSVMYLLLKLHLNGILYDLIHRKRDTSGLDTTKKCPMNH